MIWQQTMDQLRSYIEQLEHNLAEADAVLVQNSAKIDANPATKWPNGSILAQAHERHHRRLTAEAIKRCAAEQRRMP